MMMATSTQDEADSGASREGSSSDSRRSGGSAATDEGSIRGWSRTTGDVPVTAARTAPGPLGPKLRHDLVTTLTSESAARAWGEDGPSSDCANASTSCHSRGTANANANANFAGHDEDEEDEEVDESTEDEDDDRLRDEALRNDNATVTTTLTGASASASASFASATGAAASDMARKAASRGKQIEPTSSRDAKPRDDAPPAWSSSVDKAPPSRHGLAPRSSFHRKRHGGGASASTHTGGGLRGAQPAEEPEASGWEVDDPAVIIDVPYLPEPKPLSPAGSRLAPSGSVRSQAIRMMEKSPLLRPLPSLQDDPEWGLRATTAHETRPDLWTEFWSLCELSYPVIFTYVLEFLPGIVSMTLVGHMDSPKTKEYVDGVSLSTMFMNLTGVAFGFGLATAMDTLCSQAYGAGKPLKMGIYFQCGVLVLGFTVIPVFLLNWYTEDFLLWMGQPEEVSQLAGRFSRIILPGIPFLYLYELVKKLLQAQNVVAPMVYIAVLSNVVNIVFGVYLTWYTPLGYDGAAIARTISNIALPAALIPFFMWNPDVVQQWWPGWKLSLALRHLKTFLMLGIPGMFMMLLEWWAFEIMAAFVGLLPNSVVAISVQSVLANVSTMTFNFFLGIGVATNIRVGNYVGSNQPDHAKLASALGMVLSLIVSAGLALVVLATRNWLPMVFINDPTCIVLSAHAFLYLMPYQMFDAINSVMQGVFRGTGRQKLGAYINLFGYFAIGLPLGVFLAFKMDYGVEGMWLGLTLGIAVGCALSWYKIHRTNWGEMADAARVLGGSSS